MYILKSNTPQIVVIENYNLYMPREKFNGVIFKINK